MRHKKERDPSASPPPETQFISDQEGSDKMWEVSEILDERGPARTGDYLVRWKDVDPHTKKPYEPSWTKKEGCTQDLIDDWKARKARRSKSATVDLDKRSNDADKLKPGNSKKRKLVKEEKKGSASPIVEIRTKAKRPRSSCPNNTYRDAPALPLSRRQSSRSGSVSSDLTAFTGPTSPAKSDRITRSSSRNNPSTHPIDDNPSIPSRPSTHSTTRSRGTRHLIDLTGPISAVAGPGPSTAANRSRQSTPADPPFETALIRSSSQTDDSEDEGQAQTNPAESAHVDSDSNDGGSIRQFSTPSSSRKKIVRISGQAADLDHTTSLVEEKLNEPMASGWQAIEKDGENGERFVGDENDVAEILIEDEQITGQDIDADDGIGDDDLNDLDSDYDNGSILHEVSNGTQPQESQEDNENRGPSEPHPDTLALQEALATIADLQAQLTTAQSAEPVPHPDTVLLDELRSRFLELEHALQAAQSATNKPSKPAPENLPGSTSDAVVEIGSDARIAQLEGEVAKLKRAKRSLTEENGFLRQQYSEASSRAVTEVDNVRALTEQVKTLKNQLSDGLKQQRMLFDKAAKDKVKENEKLKGQLKILLDQSRLTDDSVRARAAAYNANKQELEDLTKQVLARGGEIDRLTSRIEKMNTRNEELVDQLDTLRAIKMGVYYEPGLDGQDGSSPGESDSEMDDSPMNKAKISPKKSKGPARGRVNISGNVKEQAQTYNVFQASPLQAARIAGDQEKFPERGYECKFHDGEKGCRVICETVEVGESELSPLNDGYDW
ncbi:uncharacterized protein I303_104306 [Kwoniella dejecticola CBS 10117]|uniref:Chromo domain-containing protein n=1 Tax=Kwoniella dejecticola CBS 10117 TaxID=1296121 RepID=A0A1A6A5Q1_9TREE|nr:uncharacterized protein I303_04720 [Kwoniella dejecticola CBS 10117]OBR85385.1 hypothetical protein I303_04720 [Kwoniella dejecticola CBS 10117]